MTDTFPIPVTLNTVILQYRDLERLIEEVYGRKISIPATYEMHNDSYHSLRLNDVEEDAIDMNLHNEAMDEWKAETNEYVDLELVMCDLILRGVFPARNYLIEVWW
jgi:hypothetical protein